MKTEKHINRPDETEAPTPRPVAVIDIGTTSVRMAIAEVDDSGRVRPLETLKRAVNLGRDTFTTGSISKTMIGETVSILLDYQRVLAEFEVVDPGRMRVVATSAVREARNLMMFLDRVYMATGMRVEPIDDAEVNRLTYLAIQSTLRAEPALASGRTLVVEVGGGATELLLLSDGKVGFWESYRLGSLRLPETLKAYRAPTKQSQSIMRRHIRRTVERIRRDIEPGDDLKFVALGGDARFAAHNILGRWNTTVAALPRDDVDKLAQKVLEQSPDELVRQYRLTYPDAETLGPALMAYVGLARTLDLDEILVSTSNLRDGLLMELAVQSAFTADFSSEIVRSAVELGRRFDFNEAHARYVAEQCRTLFQALREEHRLDPRFELILYVAALLHDIGNIVSSRSHHKHALYLILNSELFGLGEKDLLLVALVARYHRRAAPSGRHPEYATLDVDSRVAVSKMAAMLRVADALDRSERQRVGEIECAVEDGRFVIQTGVDDMSMEQLALRQKGALFQDIFGMPVSLRRKGT